MPKPSVFVGSSIEGLPVANVISRLLTPDADVRIWNREHSSVGAATFDSLMAVLNDTDFAVLVLTPDDTMTRRGSILRARDNILFEAGLFIGRLGTQRTFILAGDEALTSLPSDLAGVSIVSFAATDPNIDLEAALAPACHQIRLAMDSQLLEPGPNPEYSSCFIIYSAHDVQLAERLYRDLQEVGVRCWLDSKDLKIGDRWQVEINRSIRSQDKILLILSQASLNSEWARREIEIALEREKKENKTILLPLRIDESIMESDDLSARRLVSSKQISDFTDWHISSNYQRAFSRLARDLAVISATETV